MTENVKNIILKHRSVLLSEEVKSRYHLDEQEIYSAATLLDLDEAYTRKVHNFDSTVDLYRWSSSVNYLDNIKTPMVFINTADDPVIPTALLEPIKAFATNREHVLYLQVAHGGHLAFVEGGLVYPNTFTWLDRALIALIGGLALHHKSTLRGAADMF